jgi:hypothetical protein
MGNAGKPVELHLFGLRNVKIENSSYWEFVRIKHNWEVSHQYENNKDNEHVIILWARASKSWRHLRSFRWRPRLPFSYVPNEHNFVHLLRFVDMFLLKMQYSLIIWVLWNRYICILSMGLRLIDANNLLNRAVIFVLIQLKPVLYAYENENEK